MLWKTDYLEGEFGGKRIACVLPNEGYRSNAVKLGQNFLGHVAVDISQAKIAPRIIEGQLLVVQAQ